MSDLNGAEANQSGLSANTADHSSSTTTTQHDQQPVTTKDMAADIEQSNGHSLQDKTEAEVLPSENKENGSLDVDNKPTEPTVEDKMDTTEDPKDSEPAKQPTAEASIGDKRVRDEDDVEHKPTDTAQKPSSEATPVSEAATTTTTTTAAATTDASTDEPITKEVKKQKTDADATTDVAEETAPTTTESGATEESTPKKKAGRPKKDETKVPSVTDEIKDAVETVSRRTRSRGSA